MKARSRRNRSCLPAFVLCGALALLVPGVAAGTSLAQCESEIVQLREVAASCQAHPGCAAIVASQQSCAQSAQFLDHLRVGLSGRRVVRAHDVFDAYAPPLAPSEDMARYVQQARIEAAVQERLGQRTFTTVRDGVVYEGDFSAELTGFGVAIGDDGFMARGRFVNGVLSGDVGQLVTPSREVIAGQFSDGLLDGEGAVQDSTRIVSAGMFERNLIVGDFSRTHPDGRIEHVAAATDLAPPEGAVLRRAPSAATADAQRAIDRSIAWERDRPAREAAEDAARAAARAAVEAEIAESRRRDREGAARIWSATRVALGVVAETYAARERERLEQQRQQQARLEQQRQQAAMAARQGQTTPPQTYSQHADNSGGTSFEGQTTSPPEPAGQRIYDTAEEYAAATGRLPSGPAASGSGQSSSPVTAGGASCVTVTEHSRTPSERGAVHLMRFRNDCPHSVTVIVYRIPSGWEEVLLSPRYGQSGQATCREGGSSGCSGYSGWRVR